MAGQIGCRLARWHIDCISVGRSQSHGVGLEDRLSNWHTNEGHYSAVTSVAFSPDSTKIASGSADSNHPAVERNDAAEDRRTMKGTHDVNSVAFSPNGAFIVSGSDDKTVRVWNVETGAEV